jgi:alcohol dehydrogenase (cytochrome c)
MIERLKTWLVGAAAIAVAAATPGTAADVTDQDLLAAAQNNAEWLMYGRTYNNWRYSELTQITPANVSNLRPVWSLSTGGKLGGLEATPIVADGVIYISADYARVMAVDARTGVRRWLWEPEYEDGVEAELCCGPVNRGVAVYQGKVFVLTLDARIVALDAADGSVAWEKAIDDWRNGYTATGAPLVVKGKVIAGIAGAEYGVRGYIRAYDAGTGEVAWTTYTIPGPGEPGNETWPGDTWKTGGASTWVTGSYDPELNLIYWGTGNPGPWNSDLRVGDNLWSSSMIAVDADSGALKWGFQYTPNDAWDYDGNNAPVLIDVTIDGKPVKAAVQSNRNGFLYVLDRTNGDFVYAEPIIQGINWTSGIDASGRPVVNEETRPLSGGPTIEPIVPGLEGGTNWYAISYNPELGYVFLNANHWAMGMTAWKGEDVVYNPGDLYMGVDFQMYRLEDKIGYTKAFDVANRRFVWETSNDLPLFASIVSTKSGLVFTGDLKGYAKALDARSGAELWAYQTGSSINASPITYELDGTQYVAVLSGLGGDPGFYYSSPKGGMLFVFALDGMAGAPPGSSQVLIEGALPTFGE